MIFFYLFFTKMDEISLEMSLLVGMHSTSKKSQDAFITLQVIFVWLC